MFKLIEFKEETTVFVDKMMALLSVGKDSRAANFLASSFCNYYRSGSHEPVQLSAFDYLDEEYQELFFNMMLLRSYGLRGDSELHKLYVKCKQFIELT
ncbi:hypothetical protein V4T84_000012 [Vibrio parahaemolyticus]|nr:hypothetical protein [Vibrio parahaemolyticus]EHH1283003.1 hypothetical protein [Vibrio parahaemolyticus]EIZ1338263.1 hypothetical protein [Vibrio parahaemolyticus]HAS6940982.1 hypothetical protein [Vibrio parahaemolyticus]